MAEAIQPHFFIMSFQKYGKILRSFIPVVCVTNEREESVVNQISLFRKMFYSNNKATCFGL